MQELTHTGSHMLILSRMKTANVIIIGKENNMLAIGKNELGEELSNTIECPHCSKEHKIFYSKTLEGKKGSLSFYKCGEDSYLCGIEGKSVMDRFLKC
jgi:hypothetical protein